MFVTSTTRRTPGPDVRVPCPACYADPADMATAEEHTREFVVGLVEANTAAATVVTCRECRAVFHSRLPARGLAVLAGEDPAAAAASLYYPASFLQMAVAVIAVAVAVFPLVGTGFAVYALAMTWRTRRWPRTLSGVALILSLFSVPLIYLFAQLFAE